MQIRKLRLLRQKHHISMPELGRACGFSAQRVSELELSVCGVEPETLEKLQAGFERLMVERLNALADLRQDYLTHKDTLLAAVEVTHEL